MERCPQCRARLKGRIVCGRCEADLGLLDAIESQADSLSRRAVQALPAGDIPAAGKRAAAARQLHATPFHRALAGFLKSLADKEGGC